jgi:hypothetical protein
MTIAANWVEVSTRREEEGSEQRGKGDDKLNLSNL